jgi:hypothetical protein
MERELSNQVDPSDRLTADNGDNVSIFREFSLWRGVPSLRLQVPRKQSISWILRYPAVFRVVLSHISEVYIVHRHSERSPPASFDRELTGASSGFLWITCLLPMPFNLTFDFLALTRALERDNVSHHECRAICLIGAARRSNSNR